jgi:hypothetical protein
MSYRDDMLPYLALAGGLLALHLATKKKPREKAPDRTGEKCDPALDAPHGYVCATDGKEFVLEHDASYFIGYSPYINRNQVDAILGKLGFPAGDIKSFQIYMTQTSRYTLRQDGHPDPETMRALKYAENQLAAGKWRQPE